MMPEVTISELESGQALQFAFTNAGMPTSYRDVIDSWASDRAFRTEFNRLLAEAPFDAYRWETPPISRNQLDRPFEFVLINAPGFARRATDTKSFADHFTDKTAAEVISFKNIRGDATMVVPCPGTDEPDVYNHLGSFVRAAPEAQIDALWKVTAECVRDVVSERTVWLNTAGAGVAWLHVRLDSRPKYYGHRPYRRPPGE